MKNKNDFLFLVVHQNRVEFTYTWPNNSRSTGSDVHDGSVKDAARVHTAIVKRYSPAHLETIFN